MLAARKKELIELKEFIYARNVDSALEQAAIEAVNRDEETELSKKLEIANRRRAVELYYETFGEPGMWTVRIMVGAHMIVDELAAALERLGRVDELSEVNAMLADIDRMIADYQNISPEQVREEIRKMLAD